MLANTSSATDITQRPNGNYLFIAGSFGPEQTNAIVRMTATGKIKYYFYAKNLFSTERYLASMVYLENNRALIQSTDPNIDALYSNIYEGKDTSLLHLDCIIFFHDYLIVWTAFDGNLYAKHVSGIYELDEKTPAGVSFPATKKALQWILPIIILLSCQVKIRQC